MYDPNASLISLADIEDAKAAISKSPNFRRTPMLSRVEGMFGLRNMELHLKLENMQVTGSYKVRGIIHHLRHLPEGYGTEEKKLVTMSAGNYGKAFAYLTSQLGLKGMVLMPETAPPNRAKIIQSYGVDVIKMPSTELIAGVDKYVKEYNMMYMHSYDDVTCLTGHASLGLEILEQVPDPDIVLVCCGGGCLTAGTAAALKLSGHKDTRIYGVEPEGSRTMYESFRAGRAVSLPVKSVASGLSPPSAGANAYKHCREFVSDILLVSDREILESMFVLYNAGLVVEPSGAAAFAALYTNKVPDTENKRIVVVITGGNVTPEELHTHAEALGINQTSVVSKI